MNVLAKLALSLAAVTVLAAPQAGAQGLQLSLGKHTKHGSFGLTYSTGLPFRIRPAAHCPPTRVWVPGHYETRCEQVFVPGTREQVWIPPVYAWRYDACGRARQVCLQPGSWRTVCTPGHYENREVRVWVDGHWQ